MQTRERMADPNNGPVISARHQIDGTTSDGSPEPTDAKLLERTRAGDNTAFEELYRQHVDDARRVAQLVGRRDAVDDLVGEAFARVCVKEAVQCMNSGRTCALRSAG